MCPGLIAARTQMTALLMNWAKGAYYYALSGEAPDLLAALVLYRSALRLGYSISGLLSVTARTLVHELAHLRFKAEADHCPSKCCPQALSSRWWAQVTGILGATAVPDGLGFLDLAGTQPFQSVLSVCNKEHTDEEEFYNFDVEFLRYARPKSPSSFLITDEGFPGDCEP